MITSENIWQDISAIREKVPLVHSITNYVAMNNTANALLALGASPVMAHAENEVEDMLDIAGALVVNIGTLSDPWIRAMKLAIEKARASEIPIVFDPVGAGATGLRNNAIYVLFPSGPPTIIRGNASEINAAALSAATTRGVDSTESSESALHSAKRLVDTYGSTVCVSGAVDYVLDGEDMIKIHNGHHLMPKVTALGCTASVLCAAFAAVNPSPLKATAGAMATMGVAGELAAESDFCRGPGSFQVAFLDALYNLTFEDLRGKLRVE